MADRADAGAQQMRPANGSRRRRDDLAATKFLLAAVDAGLDADAAGASNNNSLAWVLVEIVKLRACGFRDRDKPIAAETRCSSWFECVTGK